MNKIIKANEILILLLIFKLGSGLQAKQQR